MVQSRFAPGRGADSPSWLRIGSPSRGGHLRLLASTYNTTVLLSKSVAINDLPSSFNRNAWSQLYLHQPLISLLPHPNTMSTAARRRLMRDFKVGTPRATHPSPSITLTSLDSACRLTLQPASQHLLFLIMS